MCGTLISLGLDGSRRAALVLAVRESESRVSVVGKGWPAVTEDEEWLRAASRPVKAVRVDSSVPNVARVWNYLIGGRDNFESDRKAARQLIAASPVMAQVGPA